MPRAILRLLAGLAMLCGAWSLHQHSLTLFKETLSPPVSPTIATDLPRRPSLVMQEPAGKAVIQQSETMANASYVLAGAGGLLALSGAVPLVFWALFGRIGHVVAIGADSGGGRGPGAAGQAAGAPGQP